MLLSRCSRLLRPPALAPAASGRLYSSLPASFSVSRQAASQTGRTGYELDPKDIADTLQNDPNLAAFFDADTLKEVERAAKAPAADAAEPYDPYDLSALPVSAGDAGPAGLVGPADSAGPQTMSTEAFVRMMAASEAPGVGPASGVDDADVLSSDDYLSEMLQQQPDGGSAAAVAAAAMAEESKITRFLRKDEVGSPSRLPTHLPLKSLVGTELPLVVVSKLTDPRLNLSIEKYIYDNYPDPKDPLNRFARRLFLYKNSNCVVLGKNQNIFREINLRLASTYSTPILRRFSGGGTVVHDLGNFNFSFICLKEDFSRTAFTTELVNNWNSALHSRKIPGAFELEINEKGDMIRKLDKKKISGSAFQISKGKSLHHGTMLLNSDLHTLGRLIKLDESRLSSIQDRATKSIPSPVTNTNMDQNTFVELCIDSFVGKFGVPTDLGSKIEKLKVDNLHLVRHHNIEAQLLKIDDMTELPAEILETYDQLCSWDWTFGKSPRFQMDFTLEDGNMKLKFDVNQGRVVGLEFDKDDDDHRLDDLVLALSTKDNVVDFSGPSVSKFVSDANLRRQLAWHIDQCTDYKRIGVQI